MGFDSDTLSQKMLKTAEKMKLDKNEVKSKMSSGRITKIYLWSDGKRFQSSKTSTIVQNFQ